ncbi:MAG: GHMP family kinase ATP-binding protein [Betaproteobacteria bacterium]
MIITRTPFRISFFGGGTDYPGWFRRHGGAVLSTTIDKYCYISCRFLPPFFEHRHRIVYSKIENVRDIRDIEHPAVRAVLDWMRWERGLEVHHDGDLPARSGLGSSSSFTVGLIHALNALLGRYVSKDELANQAIHVEQEVIREAVGSQDQVSAAFGGFNRVSFRRDGAFEVAPVILPRERLAELHRHLMLCFTGLSRYASEVAKSTIDNLNAREAELRRMGEMVEEAVRILATPSTPIGEFGRLLDESWRHKRRLSEKVSTAQVDDLYETARSAGAIGGKLMGAGGGGFMLLFVPPELQPKVRSRLAKLVHVPFEFESDGSRVVLYQPNGL